MSDNDSTAATAAESDPATQQDNEPAAAPNDAGPPSGESGTSFGMLLSRLRCADCGVLSDADNSVRKREGGAVRCYSCYWDDGHEVGTRAFVGVGEHAARLDLVDAFPLGVRVDAPFLVRRIAKVVGYAGTKLKVEVGGGVIVEVEAEGCEREPVGEER